MPELGMKKPREVKKQGWKGRRGGGRRGQCSVLLIPWSPSVEQSCVEPQPR